MTHRIAILVTALAVLAGAVHAQKRPLTFTDMFEMGRVSAPEVSPRGDWIAYTVTTYSVDDNGSRSHLHLVSPDGRRHRQLTHGDAKVSTPRWAPDGTRLAFLASREGGSEVHVLDLAGGEAQPVTDLATDITGFIWSPDGNHLLVTTDLYPEAASPSESVAMGRRMAADGASGRVIDGLMFRHWNAWKEGKFSKLLAVPVDGGEPTLLTPGAYDTPPVSLGSGHDYAWSPDGSEICFVQNRDEMVAVSTNNDLWTVSPGGGELTQITTNTGNDYGPAYSPDGRYIAYLSMARAGFEADQSNLILYDRSSGERRSLTADLDRSVADFVWAPRSDRLYFYVPHHGRHRIYSVAIAGGAPTLLLDSRYIGGLAITPDGKSLIFRHQTAAKPWELYRFEIGSKRLTALTAVNAERLAGIDMNPIEDYWFTGARGDSVHLMLIKPPQFDASKRYPVVNLIHGGPQGAWGDDFHYRWNSELFASPGYVVIMINFHGSRGYGQEFCDAVTRDWGGAPYEDIMTGTRWAVENFDFIDGERIGAAGASYGGYMINWIQGNDPDNLFKTMVSHCGVFETRSMFGATEELWFPIWEFNGKPWEAGNVYEDWNPIHHVENFETPMLVIHGEHDYRVPYTQSLQLFTALQVKGVPSRLLFYPDEYHFVTRPKNARQWWTTVHDWLARTLEPADRWWE